MRRVVLTILAATCAVAVSVGAQNLPSQGAPAGQENPSVALPDQGTPTPGTQRQTPPQTPTQTPSTTTSRTETNTAATMKMTGCIEAGTKASTYKLTNVTSSPTQQAENKPGTTGTPSVGTSGTATAASYELTAASGVDLSKHVGHKVELTGKVMAAPANRPATETAPSSGATSGTGSGATGTPSYGAPSGTTSGERPRTGQTSTTAGAAAAMPMFNVTEVKMIAASCTP